MKAAIQARLDAIHDKGRHLALVGGTAVTGLMSSAANAAVDLAPVTTEISAQQSNVETIGGVILVVMAVIAGVAILRRVIR